MYLLANGTEVSANQIKQAFAEGRAVLVHSHGEFRTNTYLRLDGVEYDTRGACYSAWDERWTQKPDSAIQALQAAYCEV